MDYAKESLRLHYEWKGKLEMVNRAAVDSAEALSLAYTPGVAAPCLEIQKDVDKSYELTRRWNTVAVVTDGATGISAATTDTRTNTRTNTLRSLGGRPVTAGYKGVVIKDGRKMMVKP